MASFDIMGAAHAGYKLAWAERHYLLRLAAVPFLIKALCFTLVLILGWDGDFIRTALVMLPSYFADGWLFAHLTRLVCLGQRWPFRPTGDTGRDMRVLQDRALGIMRGTLTFVVIRFLMNGATALLYDAQLGDAAMDAQEVNPGLLAAGVALLVFFIWVFRFFWFYIPAALNYPLGRFVRDLGGYTVSFHLIGVWLLCFIPFFFGFGFVLSVLHAVSGAAADSASMTFLANILRVLLDTLVGILSTAGVAYGLMRHVLPPSPGQAE